MAAATTATVTSKKKSKFFVDSLRAIRNHFRQIYRKCSCNLDTGKLPCMGEPNNNNGKSCFGNGECFGTLFHEHASSWSCPLKNNNQEKIKNNNNNNNDTKNMFCRLEQNVRYSHEDYLWIGEMSQVSVGGLILPSPPPTPKEKISLNHPDGDFLYKVIPPPLEFQDRYYQPQQQHRPSSALSYRHRRFCHHQNSYGGLTRTESEASLGLVVVRDEDQACLQLPALSTLPPPLKRLSRQEFFPEPRIAKEQLLGVGTKSFWHNLKQFSNLSYSDPIISPSISSPPVVRKAAANPSRRTEGSLLGNFTLDSSSAAAVRTSLPGSMDVAKSIKPPCRQSDTESKLSMELPAGPRSRIQYLISILPSANWNTVNLYTNHLKSAARKTPKAFSAHIESLVTTLLEQIGDSKSRIAGPAIRILNNICEYKSHLFEGEAERIIEVMLSKLGGPSFIEKESNQVLKHVVQALTPPSRAILTLVKLGGNHRISAARQSTIQLVEEAIKKLDLISELGLPGEQTTSQRRLSNAVFDIATRFLRDSSAHTRLTARNIYQHLMRHPGFWYLYQSTLPEEKRQWVNRLLDEMRRHPPAAVAGSTTGDRKVPNSRCSNNNSNNFYKNASLA